MQGFRRSLAVLVAVDRYGNGIPPLRTPVADAEKLAVILSRDHGFETEIIADENATRPHLQAFLADLQDRVGPDDRVLFYFAGHGIAVDSDKGPEGYLLLQDADRNSTKQYLSMVKLNEALSKLSCRHMLAILDCCFAGAFRWSGTRDLVLAPEDLHQERYSWFVRDAAWQAITSAAHDQKALDVAAEEPLGKRDDTQHHSPFAKALMDGLAGAADRRRADGTGDGVITATELYLYLEERLMPDVGSGRPRQTPLLWPLAKHDKGQFVFLAPGRNLDLPPAPKLDSNANPWRGLKPYESAHSDLFFGRRAASDQLLERVLNERFVVVAGPSGIGKSSLVRAGVLPRLPSRFRPIILRPSLPGPTPFASLAAALREDAVFAAVAPDDHALKANPAALTDWIEAHGKDHEILLVIDQAEELITLGHNEEVAEKFVRLIAHALDRGSHRFRAIFTVRSEFEPQFTQSSLSDRWPPARYLVPQMTQDELRRVIEGPAAVKVMRFESADLVDKLVNEVVQMPGALPLLSFALSEMYAHYLRRRRDDRVLTEDDYKALQGGVTGSLRVSANQVVDGVDVLHQETTRRVLERLVSVESGEFARRRVSKHEFEARDAGEKVRVQEVLKRLDEARLIITDEVGTKPHFELAHDALILGWNRLHTWVRQDAALIADLRRLTPDAEEWVSTAKQKSGLLWSDSARLGTIRRLQAAASPGLNETESAFAEASIRRAWRNKLVRVALGILLVVAAGAAIYTFVTGQQAQQLALYRRYSADMASVERAWSSAGDIVQARAVLNRYSAASEAEKDPRSFEWHAYWRIVTAEQHSLGQSANSANASALSEVGPLAAVATEDNPVVVFNPVSRAMVATLSAATKGAKALEFTPDGSTLVVGGVGELRLRSTREPEENALALPGAGKVHTLALLQGGNEGVLVDEEGRVFSFDLGSRKAQHRFSIEKEDRYASKYKLIYAADGDTIVLASQDGKLRLLDPRTLVVRKTVVDSSVRLEGAWATKSGLVLMPTNDRITVLDAQTGTLSPTAYFGGYVSTVGISQDGKFLAVGGGWRGIEVWRTPNLRNSSEWRFHGVLRGFSGWPSSARFVPGSSLLLGTTLAGDIKVWETSRIGPETFLAHRGDVVAARMLAIGDDLVSVDSNGLVRRWTPASDKTAWSTQLDDAKGMAVADALALVGIANWSGTVTFLNLADGGGATRQPGYAPIASSRDGGFLAWIGDDGHSIVVHDASHKGPTRIELPKAEVSTEREPDIVSLAVSPDGGTFAVGTATGVVLLVDSQSRTIREARKLTERIVWSLAFSPDGRYLAAGGSDNLVHILGTSGAEDVASLSGHWGAVFSLAFSPNGKTLVSGGRDGLIRLWNTAAWQEMITFSAHQADADPGVQTLAFSRAGDKLVSGGARGRVIVWQAEPTAAAAQ